MEKNRLDYRDSAGYAEPSAPPRPQPNYLVRYIPIAHNEKIAVNPNPVFIEHGNRIDADDYVAGLVRNGQAVWGSVEVFENTHAVVQINVVYNAPQPARAY